MKALATSSADLRANQSVTCWRRVDGVNVVTRCRRHGAGSSTPGFKCRTREAASARTAQEAVGMDQKLQRAAPDDRCRARKRGAAQNAGETSGCKALETRFANSGMLPLRENVV